MIRWHNVHPYLRVIGIPVWQLRQPLPNANPTSIYQCYALCDEQGQERARLLLDGSIVMANAQEKAASLLNAMLRAIGMQRRWLPQTEKPQTGNYLIMGEALAQSILNTPLSLAELRGQARYTNNQQKTIVVTYHPIDLLHQPANKRNAWADLQLAAQAWTNN